MKKHKGIKIAGIVLGIIVLIFAGGYLYVCYHPQVIVGIIQSALYQNGQEINPDKPLHEPNTQLKENGILYTNDIKYGDTYPNSYMDISYPNDDISVDRPTIVYFHGGGYFGGDKVLGDPLAVNDDSTYLFDQFVMNGYNFINVNYVLVPDYHFPDPIIQMNEALNYLTDNQKELGINMDDVTLFGQSAGAIMVSQYGAVLSNPAYKALFQFTEEPKLQLENIHALIIDDAPLDIDHFDNFSIKMLIANYLDDSIFFGNKALANQYNPMNYFTASYPRSFVTAGTDDGFPEDMQKFSDMLTNLGVENTYFYTEKDKYGLTAHGYLSNLKYDTSGAAQDCYDAIITFL